MNDLIRKYNIIDLFCGCGGLSYGFEQVGYKTLLGIDFDEKAIESFLLNHQNVKAICGDITRVTYENDINPLIGNKPIDVIIGGPPCQGMSLSGFRKLDDPRNRLYLSYIRLVREIQPRAFVIENVPGLVGLFKGEIKDSIIDEFTKLGYAVKYEILCSSDYGVPQARKRVFFVGIKGETNNFMFPKPYGENITCEMALSDLPPLVDNIGIEDNEYETAVQNEYQRLMRKNSNIVKNHIAAQHSDRVREIIALVPDGCNYKSLPVKYRNTRNFNVAWTRFRSDKPAPTIDTGHRHHFHYKYNRVPTVRECARLQSFPDDFIFIGNKTEQFRQVGNAVPPLMAKVIAEALYNYLMQEEMENV